MLNEPPMLSEPIQVAERQLWSLFTAIGRMPQVPNELVEQTLSGSSAPHRPHLPPATQEGPARRRPGRPGGNCREFLTPDTATIAERSSPNYDTASPTTPALGHNVHLYADRAGLGPFQTAR